MDIFDFRKHLIDDYQAYISSFIRIRDSRINDYINNEVLENGLLWPEPLIQLNPSFEPGDYIDDLVKEKTLHPECGKIFRIKPDQTSEGKRLRLHKHQSDAVRTAVTGRNYVLTTGTGSGKSLAYLVPIVNHVLRNGSGKGIQAIIVYPMNALANSQFRELKKFVCHGYPDGKGPVTFRRYTGQEKDEERKEIIANPPDIILTNYVMLELILTRPDEKGLINAAQDLRFLVLDELHTYRGRQGSDVALLVRRVRELLNAKNMQCVGTSATIVRHGTVSEQKKEVSDVASLLFGAPVNPQDIITETVQRATPERSLENSNFVNALRNRISNLKFNPPAEYQQFIQDPISSWIETTFGIRTEPQSGRLLRADPQTIWGDNGGAAKLATLTGLDIGLCGNATQKGLLAGFNCKNPETEFPAFAFRLHQFISKGDTAYASLEDEQDRYLTINGQQFVPGHRDKILLPIVFCRECGQEYYAVRQTTDPQTNQRKYGPRDAYEKAVKNKESVDGFLFHSSSLKWPTDESEMIERVPDDWLEDYNGRPRVRRDRRDDLPKTVRLNFVGNEDEEGLEFQFTKAPFRFCLACGVSYGFRQSSDFGKLASLGSEGRSTATTILSLNSILLLKKDQDLQPVAKKLLSFTDNRQDASLQAGHFNDFVEIGLLRSALFKAVQNEGHQGITHELLTQRVFDALNLPLEQYSPNPSLKFAALAQTQKALREVLGYRIYRDLKRGWRVTAPNLEQCGLLEIGYQSLDELCADEEVWKKCHPAMASADLATRQRICKVLLDFMRRELAIKVDYLDSRYQETIEQVSSQFLIPPWGIDENERNNLEHSAILFPRPRLSDYRGNVFLSPRGGFGMYLGRQRFPSYSQKLNLEDKARLIKDLLDALRVGGLVEIVQPSNSEYHVPGYQLQASCMIWKPGDGTKAFYDPIRVPGSPESGGATNSYFINLYKSIAGVAHGIHAREHTAQVQEEVRQERERDFGEGKLPILYCSPTMELGVDIKELNVVNLRNVPPTSANYSQRSGRAGRSGQPALVFSYCSTGSPHDQYFFKRPHLMVSGAVTPPRLDLTNEDLIRAHVHAIWIAEAGLKLGRTLKEILDVSGETPSLALLEDIRHDLEAERPRERAKSHAQNVLGTIEEELKDSDWYTETWLDEVFQQLERKFESACERWRGLYRAALSQAKNQTKIIHDASKSAKDKDNAHRLRREAESQLKLLTEAENVVQSDFYSYRYFASEGFLPGYNFPRLPLSAFIPGRISRQRDEFLSRPRFIAISEFGPKATVYHEGSRYQINKVMLPVMEQDLLTVRAKQCDTCSYLHQITDGEGPDLCERCGAGLPAPISPLLRLQNVETKRRDRINSDEEERLRLGYEIKTAYRFSEISGAPAVRKAIIKSGEEKLAELSYGPSATLWRINLGWARRVNKDQHGFVLDIERGYWAKSDDIEDDEDDPISTRKRRVIPYVEDRRNCLIFTPSIPLTTSQMASLQAALKNAIQVQFQLEDSELAVEPLPSRDERRAILLYESSEGGAGVLRRLIDDVDAIPNVCKSALQVCHFDPQTGADMRRAPRSKEDCEAACYDCLLSYSNQRDHEILDRKEIQDILMQMSKAQVEAAPVNLTRSEHLTQLMRLCGSDLERSFLRLLETEKLRLPSKAQCLIESCKTRPDFFYDDGQVAIYIDGPHHLYPHRHDRDISSTEMMEDNGYLVIRFSQEEDWLDKIRKYPNVFGKLER